MSITLPPWPTKGIEEEDLNMKKVCMLLASALLFCLCFTAQAEEGVSVEVIKMDGISVVELIPEETTRRARGAAEKAGLVLPGALTIIEESAFEGVIAETVEVSENVVSIEARAFAGCKNLREIAIPATVLTIDETALAGCKNVIVYGAKDSAAEKFVQAVNAAEPEAGFVFVDVNAEPAIVVKAAPVVLPFVPAD